MVDETEASMLVCTAAQMREIDRTAIEEYGVPGVVLMESAGRGVVEVLAALRPLRGLRVVVLCGGGNNGGDGFVIARHLIGRGARVRVGLAADRARVAGDALINLRILERMKAEIVPLIGEEDLATQESALLHAEVIVDALLGTGLSSDVRGTLRHLLERVNRCAALKIAVDIPSGLNADNGQVMGVAFAADHTVTFGYPKVGLVTHPGAEHAGELHVVDIGVPAGVEVEREFVAEMLEAEVVGRWLQHRPLWGHKGTYGHLLVIAGSPGKTGAAMLCAESALRAGVGLCTVAAPPLAMRAMENKTVEVMLAPLTPDAMEVDDSDAIFGPLVALLDGKAAIAIGPGIPRGPGMAAFIRRLVRESPIPIVIDADGLNELAHDLSCLRQATVPVLLTPHPGEMSTLTGRAVPEIQADRLRAAVQLAEAHGVHVALKGFRTVIAAPDGRVFINPTGNSGMGSGGTGDVLTGLVGSFLAQQHAPLDALCLGVFVHGVAGDRAAARIGQRGMLASDLLAEIGGVLKQWE
jgi:ADP-dependent NAD(P)H-hydrate dehydratase / NAD(P)H-hydrate epimerase